ncbi:MAG: glycoside hydrolase [Nitrospirota bacterium]|nr:glycoside hydrolase [Nitrospirota bacterium]
MKPSRVLFFASFALVCGSGSLLSPVIATEPPSHSVTLGSKYIIEHKGMQTTGPMAQLAKDGTLHLIWGGEQQKDRGVFYLHVKPKQEHFPDPVKISPASTPAATLHEPPALALGKKNDVYITWTTPHPNAMGKLFTSLLLLSRSLDGGQTFLPPVRVNDDEAITGHSFDHVTVSPNGSVHITWLDNREGKKDPATYTSMSHDQGLTLSPNLKLDEPTCVCCRTFATTAPDGTVYVAWRKIFPGSIRETVVARSIDDGQSFSPSVIVGHDQWAYEGCPHRPATMGVDQHGRLYVAWYTEGPDDSPGVYFSYSDDQGATFTPRRQLNLSKGTFPDHPQLAVNQHGQLLVAWEEQSPVRREVVLSTSLDRGQTFSSPQKLNTKKSKSPAVALNDEGQAVMTWLEQIAFPAWSTVVQPLTLPASSTAPGTPQ